MKLQYTTDCALRMMVYLTGKNGIISSRELEQKIHFPQQCIFSAGRKLKKAGYISTVSGPFGGYTLGKSPEDITIQGILLLFKDSFSICCEDIDEKQIPGTACRNYIGLLRKVKDDFAQEMSTVTLASLLKKKNSSDT